MEDQQELISECHPVLFATELYADYLNSTSMSNHIMKVLGSGTGVDVAPYCYFHQEFMDYEPKRSSGDGYSNEILRADYPVDKIDLGDTADIVQYLVPTYRKHLPIKNGKIANKICGLIGVPILDIDDPDIAIGDHYVSYVYEDGVLNYFDSAIDAGYKDTETYQILIATFNPKKIVRNKKTFETAGGVSESPYNYIAQNIFCHTWALWFIYNFVVEKKSMASIDRLSSRSKGSTKDKKNLIRIKKFVYELLIPRIGLTILYDFSLFNSFRFIIISDNPKKIEEIIPPRR